MNPTPDPLHRKQVAETDAVPAMPEQANQSRHLPAGDAAHGEKKVLGEYRFTFVRWPNGHWTIALDRDYAALELDEF